MRSGSGVKNLVELLCDSDFLSTAQSIIKFIEYAEKMQQAILWESQKNDSNAACYNETRNAFSDAKNKLYTKAGRDEYNNVFK